MLAGLAVVGGLLNLPFKTLEFLGHWLEPVFEGVPEIEATSFVSAAFLLVDPVGDRGRSSGSRSRVACTGAACPTRTAIR